MKFTITISKGYTVNLGNYESARGDYTITAELPDSLAEQAITQKAIENSVNAWIQREVKKVQEAAGLPPLPSDRFTG